MQVSSDKRKYTIRNQHIYTHLTVLLLHHGTYFIMYHLHRQFKYDIKVMKKRKHLNDKTLSFDKNNDQCLCLISTNNFVNKYF